MSNRTTIGDYVTLQRGTTYKGMLVGKPGPALLGLGSIQPGGGFRESDYKTYGGECPPKLMLAPGDLFVSLKGATKDGEMIGSVARVPVTVPSGRLTQDTVKLEFSDADKETVSYIYWILRTPQYRSYCAGHATGSAVVALSRGDFLSYPVPPLTEANRQIVELLEAIEEKVTLNRQMNETLEEMARTLFRSWFVDFDPVHAKAAGHQPEGMDAETAVLFPSEFVESELGMIPKGWVMATINDVAAINARTLSKNDALDRIRYIEISEVQRGEIGNIAEYERGQEPSRARRRLQHGDTAMSTVRPDRGAYFLAHHPEEDLIASTGFAVLTPQTVPWAFLFLSLTQPEVFTYLGHIADGGAYPAINPGAIGDLRLVLPDEAVLKTFSDLVTPILEQMEEVRKENRGLAVLRDELLPKLISGDVRIPEDMIAEFASGAESA